ncbi:MAG: arginyltransferase [Campylobacterales bacterium]|nr:arginyltransferase [Campylobacterales bacterium]
MEELILYDFIAEDKPCPYLENTPSKTKYHWMEECTTDAYQKMLEHGYRRFGKLFFNPICEGCYKCLSVRINPQTFLWKRKFKRVLKKNQDLTIVVNRPSITTQHIELHNKYHQDMQGRRDWTQEDITVEQYYRSFVEGAGDFGYEFLYFLDEKLISVALVDILPKSVSAVYCFYDPDYRDRSLGTLSILKQLQIAKQNSIDYVYLGYMVRENQSLKYKENFKPLEILSGRPELKATPYWLEEN